MMSIYDFDTIGLPADDLRRLDGSYFFDRPLAESGSKFKSAFQKQHVHPKGDMTVLGEDFVKRISSTDVDLSIRFNGADFALNGSALPYSYADGVRMGMSTHRGSHGSYTAIVGKYREAVTVRADIVKEFKFNEIMRSENAPSFEDGLKSAEKFANNFMAREWRGVENALRLAYQIDGIPEAKISNRPALVMHEGDLFLRSSKIFQRFRI